MSNKLSYSNLDQAFAVVSSENDASMACKTCLRTAVDVQLEEHHTGFLPYGSCSDCGLVCYHRRDPDKREMVKGKKWTILTGLIRKKKWDLALQRLSLYPKEAKRERGKYKKKERQRGEFEITSALYHAVNVGAPLDLVKRLAQAAPEEICLPFYNYKDFIWGDEMRFMHDPQGEIVTKRKSPLQLTISKAKDSELSLEVVKALLIIHLERTGGRGFPHKIVVSLNQAWEALESRISSAATKDLPSGEEAFQALGDATENVSKWKRCWEVLSLVYRAAYFKRLHEGQSVLQAIACVNMYEGCPSDLLRFAVKLYPEELGIVDQLNGDMILHSVSQSRRPKKPSNRATDRHPNPSFHLNDDEDYWIDDLFNPYKTSHLEILVEAHPRAAAVRNQDSSLPLHLAIRAGRKWKEGVQAIVSAYPDGLKYRDPCEPTRGLYPFMQAAAFEVAPYEIDDDASSELDYEDDSLSQYTSDYCDDDGDEDTIGLIYNLLRKCPEVCVLGGGNGSSRFEGDVTSNGGSEGESASNAASSGSSEGDSGSDETEPAAKKMRTGA